MQSCTGDGGRCAASRSQLTQQLDFELSARRRAPLRNVVRGALRQCIPAPLTRELVISIVPFSSCGRGFFSGKAVVETLLETDARPVSIYLHTEQSLSFLKQSVYFVICIQSRFPRFQGENLEKNKVLYERVAALAKRYKCTPGQLALAWVLHQGTTLCLLQGGQQGEWSANLQQKEASGIRY